MSNDAADLFAQSATTISDDGAKRTLELLTMQHRKLAKDVERRIASQASQATHIVQAAEGTQSGAGVADGGGVAATASTHGGVVPLPSGSTSTRRSAGETTPSSSLNTASMGASYSVLLSVAG